MLEWALLLIYLGFTCHILNPLFPEWWMKPFLQLVVFSYLMHRKMNGTILPKGLRDESEDESEAVVRKESEAMTEEERNEERSEIERIMNGIDIIRCSTCDTPIDVQIGADLEDVRCPQCGNCPINNNRDLIKEKF